MMKRKIIFYAAVVIVASIMTVQLYSANNNKQLNVATIAGQGFAVVELFTSEGCSSCPPADNVVARIESESGGKPVYILSYHVDYWNRLGWKDVFSDAAFSRRQGMYAKWLKLSSVYTPQVVVNGEHQFTGSQETTLRNAIAAGLSKQNTSNLSIKTKNNSVDFNAVYDEPNTSLVIAFVQKQATTQVKAGENAGRKLTHVQIVRSLKSINLQGKKSGTINLNNDQETVSGSEVIAFLQNISSGEIIAATKATL